MVTKEVPLDLLTSPDREAEDQDMPLDEMINSMISSLPTLDRDQISNIVEGLLVKQLLGRGDPMTPAKNMALSALARKYIPNAETLRQEKDPVDHWRVLSDVLQGNTDSFIKLEKLAIGFREHEQAHRDTLLEAVKDVEAQKQENISHIPDLSEGNDDGFTGNIRPQADFRQNAPQGINAESPQNNRLNEVVNIRQDGFPSPRPSDFLPHSSR